MASRPKHRFSRTRIPHNLTKSWKLIRDDFQPQNQVESGLVAEIVAARWGLFRVWRYETAMLDVEMDRSAEDFEKKFETFDEDMRGADAFSKLSNRSGALTATLQFDKHFGRTFRRTLDQLRRLQSGNEPAEPPKKELNGEN